MSMAGKGQVNVSVRQDLAAPMRRVMTHKDFENS